MGREARAAARYGEAAGMVTALLEGDLLILRGQIRASIPRSAIRDVVVEDGELRFRAGDVPAVLTLGTTAARRWATSLAAGPPTLEKKLGIDASTHARVYGTVDDDALAAALARAATVTTDETRAGAAASLVFIRASGGRELETALDRHLAAGSLAPLWVVYRKGKDVPLNEAAVRAAVRARGFVDTKVAGISPALSALRFTKPATSASNETSATLARPSTPRTSSGRGRPPR